MIDLTASEHDALTGLVLDALDDLKAVDPVVIDVKALSSVMDFLVIASGTSTRHVKSLADNVIMRAKSEAMRPIGIEGESVGEWVLVDFGDVVVHVMQPATRSFYDLERLWAAPPNAE
ncbi:MAG: ribosome silencing factor [Halieaceae bacterium]|nr:ribosome silencing factor [Halieaceae bacterium]MDG1493865.1 ribosome silencing factor [Luminiphilus sp.]MBT6265436.1 ribosome silencing factor [Halieaceae bacterium]MBT6334023.1 ribosome silencing factor [Halieaceae bacterium]MBT7341761.1 ribosome silencing factor [Halieaceae bacterium]